MAAYLECRHHPREALAPRVAYLARVGGIPAGYIAGHLTRRYGCQGEVQYLYVALARRRAGVATALLRQLAQWFADQGAARICVNLDPESAGARRFYVNHGAQPLRPHWLVWQDIGAVRSSAMSRTVEDELIGVTHAWDRAMVANDPEAIGRFMAEDWVIVGPDGSVGDRATFLELVRSGRLTHDVMESHDLKVRVYGDAAVVIARGVSGGRYRGEAFHLVERASCVFVRQGGDWRCVLTHLSPLTRRRRAAAGGTRRGSAATTAES
jgi:ketosteroid isomerase-like protein